MTSIFPGVGTSGTFKGTKTTLMNHFLCFFCTFEDPFRYIFGETLHLRESVTLGLALPGYYSGVFQF